MTPIDKASSDILQPASNGWQSIDKWVLAAILSIFAARLLAVFITPLTLDVDEAQYWVWSQNPDFGYYSKPPLIAWIIGLSHAIFGHSSWAVRLPAPALHLGIALLLWRAGFLLYGAGAGRIAGLLWTMMPAVALGSFVITTDSPMLLFWSAALLFFIKAQCPQGAAFSPSSIDLRWLFAAGLAVGFAMLGKYAALYFLLGAVLYLGWVDPRKFALRFGVLLAGFLIAASPNLVWNLANGFVTFFHLGYNANLSVPAYSPMQIAVFLANQLAVFGPLTFILCLVAVVRFSKGRLLLLSFSLPIILIMMVQAYLKEANANWAVAAYPALTILLGGWLAEASGGRLRALCGRWALALNGIAVLVAALILAAGSLGPIKLKSDPLRHLRGWDALAADMAPHLDAYQIKTVLADNRASAAILPFYLYPRPITVRLFDADNRPSNHFERAYNFTPDSYLPALAISEADIPPAPNFVNWRGPIDRSSHRISQNHSLIKDFYISP